MTPRSRRSTEIETLAELDRRLAAGATSITGWHLQGLDLRGRGDALRRVEVRGAVVLGGQVDPADEEDLRMRGALVFPSLPGVPVDPYRPHLYSPAELYDEIADWPYEQTLDARAYGWASQASDLAALVAQALHDVAVDDALAEAAVGHRVVGVMGGHAAERGTDAYLDAARLGRSLARAGLTVATGGGPGAMEAANLGAYLSPYDDVVLDESLEVLDAVPTFDRSVTDWARAAFDVRRRWPDGATSIGVPTWFYGHEPPNAFATHVAKYFKNAIREDVLLHLCDAGVVFLPGRGGTVQEVFQDACENYYADPGAVAPMVLVGHRYWTHDLPVWPLLCRLAAGRAMADAIHLVDDVEEVAALLGAPDRLAP